MYGFYAKWAFLSIFLIRADFDNCEGGAESHLDRFYSRNIEIISVRFAFLLFFDNMKSFLMLVVIGLL